MVTQASAEAAENSSHVPGMDALYEFCGPHELAAIVERFRAREDAGNSETIPIAAISRLFRASIAGKSLQDLFSLAYQASFLKDEGRHTRCRLFFPAPGKGHPRKVIPFQIPKPLTEAKTLRLLGPTLASDDYALSLGHDGTGLFCDGIFLMNEKELDVPVPEISLSRSGGYHGLDLSIVDPGELVISEGALRLRVRANRIVDEGRVPLAPLVWDWLEACMDEVFNRYAAKLTPGSGLPPFAPRQDINWIWSRILSNARDLKHGGCFVIVEQTPPEFIDVKFPTQQVPLGEQIAQYWFSGAQAFRLKDQDGFAEAVRECNRCKNVVLASIRALGHLSATDGCVVLGRDLSLFGFGGIIKISPDTPKPQRRLVNYKTKTPESEEQLLRDKGTRHQSAFQLCKYLDNTIAFVISQDGDVSVFSSDKDGVYSQSSLSILQ